MGSRCSTSIRSPWAAARRSSAPGRCLWPCCRRVTPRSTGRSMSAPLLHSFTSNQPPEAPAEAAVAVLSKDGVHHLPRPAEAPGAAARERLICIPSAGFIPVQRRWRRGVRWLWRCRSWQYESSRRHRRCPVRKPRATTRGRQRRWWLQRRRRRWWRRNRGRRRRLLDHRPPRGAPLRGGHLGQRGKRPSQRLRRRRRWQRRRHLSPRQLRTAHASATGGIRGRWE